MFYMDTDLQDSGGGVRHQEGLKPSLLLKNMLGNGHDEVAELGGAGHGLPVPGKVLFGSKWFL